MRSLSLYKSTDRSSFESLLLDVAHLPDIRVSPEPRVLSVDVPDVRIPRVRHLIFLNLRRRLEFNIAKRRIVNYCLEKTISIQVTGGAAIHVNKNHIAGFKFIRANSLHRGFLLGHTLITRAYGIRLSVQIYFCEINGELKGYTYI